MTQEMQGGKKKEKKIFAAKKINDEKNSLQ